MRVHGAQTIALAPLSDSETAALITELLGADPSVRALGQSIADRAAGNPFFAEPTATRPRTRTSGTATATWRKRLASRDI
jgi:hypothetical protein